MAENTDRRNDSGYSGDLRLGGDDHTHSLHWPHTTAVIDKARDIAAIFL